MAQHQVEAVVSHLSTDPQKAATLTLLGDQVDLLAKDGSPNSAAFLDAVEAKALVSADDVFSLRSNFGVWLIYSLKLFRNTDVLSSPQPQTPNWYSTSITSRIASIKLLENETSVVRILSPCPENRFLATL